MFLEFLIFGLIVGVVEDLLAVYLSTGDTITPHIIGIVILVAIPFAILGELVVDKLDFTGLIEKIIERKKK